jgi:hypothetical protein
MNDIARTKKCALHIRNSPFEKPHKDLNAQITYVYIYRVLTKEIRGFKFNQKSISQLTRVISTPLATATIQVFYVLPAVRFKCLQRGRGASFKDGVAAGEGFLCAPFSSDQISDYSAA